MRPRQYALLSESSLVTLLETAAIRYASKNAWNELGIVDQAEPKRRVAERTPHEASPISARSRRDNETEALIQGERQ
jgi:hypothetical protein